MLREFCDSAVSDSKKASTTDSNSMETNDGDDFNMDFARGADYIEATIDAKIWAEDLLRQEAKAKVNAHDSLANDKNDTLPPYPPP